MHAKNRVTPRKIQSARRLNIAVVIPFLDKYGGAERYVIECVRFWQYRHDITIYASEINKALLIEHDTGEAVRLVKLTSRLQWIKWIIQLYLKQW